MSTQSYASRVNAAIGAAAQHIAGQMGRNPPAPQPGNGGQPPPATPKPEKKQPSIPTDERPPSPPRSKPSNLKVLRAAIKAHSVGLCAVPVNIESGREKTPCNTAVTAGQLVAWGLTAEQVQAIMGKGEKSYHFGWKQWQYVLPSVEQLRLWYESQAVTGFGLVCGKVSRYLELLDFDTKDIYAAYVDRASEMGVGDLVARVAAGYLSNTPSGGHHLPYRCPSGIEGSQKLAMRLVPEPENPKVLKHKALIETKGEGGYSVEPPSFGKVHRTGRPYVQVSGGPETIATVTAAEREALLEVARSLDELPKAAAPTYTSYPSTMASALSEDLPGNDFNTRAAWDQILTPHGWKRAGAGGDGDYSKWVRPGKSLADGIGATTGYQGGKFQGDQLFVFTSSTVFQANHAYSKFKAFTLLEHGGDYKAAARDLYAQGYGKRQTVGQSLPAYEPTEPSIEDMMEDMREDMMEDMGVGLTDAPAGSSAPATGPPQEQPPPDHDDDGLPQPAKGLSLRMGNLDHLSRLRLKAVQADTRGLRGNPEFGHNTSDLLCPNSGYIFPNRENMLVHDELMDVLRDAIGVGKEVRRLERCGRWRGNRCKDTTCDGSKKALNKFQSACKTPYHYLPREDGPDGERKPEIPHWTTTQKRLADLTLQDQVGGSRYVALWFVGTERYADHPSKDVALRALLDRGEDAVEKINSRKRFRKTVLSRASGFALQNGYAQHIFAVTGRLASDEEQAAFKEAFWKEYGGFFLAERSFTEGNKFLMQLIADSTLTLLYADRNMGEDELRESVVAFLSATRRRHMFQLMGELHQLQQETPPPPKKEHRCPICGGPMTCTDEEPPGFQAPDPIAHAPPNRPRPAQPGLV